MEFSLDNIENRKGKVAIVTGANNGIGFETTVGLAQVGYKVIMACRSMEKARKAKEEITERVPSAELDIIELDLSKLTAVREFASQFRSKYDQLNLLINNAGVLDYSGRRNEEGIEIQLATNHLGHFLLTSLLIDLMPDTPNSRIISLSSVAHKKGIIHFDDLNCEEAKDSGDAYAQSKLACLMFADELHRRLVKSGKQIRSICVHPGGSDSGLFKDMSRLRYYILKLLSPIITHSNEDAAKPSLYAALQSDAEGGGYYGPQGLMDLKGPPGPAKRTEYSKDPDAASKLWDVSLQLTGAKYEF